MTPTLSRRLRIGALAGALVLAAPVEARVTKIVIDDRQPLSGQTLAYEQISGRAFGELDPSDPLNAIIQDIDLGKDKDGKVKYTASFVLTKPVVSVRPKPGVPTVAWNRIAEPEATRLGSYGEPTVPSWFSIPTA